MEPTTAPVHLSIFHTNDMHGHLEAMARLSGLARRHRAEAQARGRQVFFWDTGDASDRRVRVASISKGAAFSPILAAMGYTLQTMGNAISLPYGPQAMADVAARAGFPILAANFRDGDGPLPGGLCETERVPLPSGLTMGIVGLTAHFGGIYEFFGLHLPDFCQVARGLIDRLREEGVAPVIVLSHLGLEDDRRLAETVAGIDLIVGGHSHDRLPAGEERNGVLIAQAGEYAESLGRVDLVLDPASGQVLERAAQVLDVPADEPPAPAVIAAIAAAEREVDAMMARPVGVLESPLDLDYFAECGVGNLAADALRERMGAEVAIICSGQFHQGLSAGTLTLGQLDRACFSSANPCVTGVRGAQIVAALERGLDPAICRAEVRGFRGAPVGIPQISGMAAEYDPGVEKGHRVRRVIVGGAQGRPLDVARSYRVAHTDAEILPEVGCLVLDEGQTTEHEVPTIVREVIEDYVHRHSPLARPTLGRWLPVPRSQACG